MILKKLTTIFLVISLLPALAYGAAFQFGGIRHDLTSITSAAGTTTLTKTSTQVQRVTGSTTQTIKLPNCTTLAVGYWYIVSNDSSGSVTVTDSSGNTLATLANTDSAKFYVHSVGSADNWNVHKSIASSSGGSGWSGNTKTCSSSCTAGSTDDFIFVTSAATVTLRAATSTRTLTVSNLSTARVDVIPAGSDTILFDTMMILSGTRGESYLMISNGGTTWGVF